MRSRPNSNNSNRSCKSLPVLVLLPKKTVYAGTVVHFGPVYKEILEDIRNGVVFEKSGESITKNMFDSERERRLEEQWRKIPQGPESCQTSRTGFGVAANRPAQSNNTLVSSPADRSASFRRSRQIPLAIATG